MTQNVQPLIFPLWLGQPPAAGRSIHGRSKGLQIGRGGHPWAAAAGERPRDGQFFLVGGDRQWPQQHNKEVVTLTIHSIFVPPMVINLTEWHPVFCRNHAGLE